MLALAERVCFFFFFFVADIIPSQIAADLGCQIHSPHESPLLLPTASACALSVPARVVWLVRTAVVAAAVTVAVRGPFVFALLLRVPLECGEV